jgi:hypothetical protein
MQKLAGIAFTVGSLLFLYAAFSPISNRFFREPDVQKRIAIIEADPTGWATNATLFGAGAAVAGVGFVLLAWHMIRRSRDPATRLLAILAAGAGGAGAAFGLVNYYAGAVRTPEEFASGTVTWTGYAYVLLTQLGLLMTALALLRPGYPRWFGWTVLVLTALTVIILVLVRNFPPLLFNLITVFIGIVLLLIPTVDRDSGRMETTTPS